MKSRFVRFLTLLVGIILLAAIIFAMSGEPGAASGNPTETFQENDNADGNVSSKSISKLSSSESQPWTQERMQAAQPYPLDSLDSELEFSLLLNHPQAEPGFIPGSPPSAGRFDVTFQQDANTIAQATTSGYNYPAPFVQFVNFDSYQVYPYSTVGVLFFTQYGVDYRCSAASIGNYAIWTAGHCIHKGDNNQNGWSYNVIFAPAYKNGTTPFGVWIASNSDLFTKNSWKKYGDLRYDMGGAVLKEWNNQTISDVVGNLGFAYNQDSDLHWLNLGYPSSAPFDGKTQQICAAPFAYADMSMPSPSPISMGCNMTQGSSGGPWILSFSGQVGQANLLNGNNSYRYSFHPKELFSPYFGTEAKILYDQLKTSIPTK